MKSFLWFLWFIAVLKLISARDFGSLPAISSRIKEKLVMKSFSWLRIQKLLLVPKNDKVKARKKSVEKDENINEDDKDHLDVSSSSSPILPNSISEKLKSRQDLILQIAQVAFMMISFYGSRFLRSLKPTNPEHIFVLRASFAYYLLFCNVYYFLIKFLIRQRYKYAQKIDYVPLLNTTMKSPFDSLLQQVKDQSDENDPSMQKLTSHPLLQLLQSRKTTPNAQQQTIKDYDENYNFQLYKSLFTDVLWVAVGILVFKKGSFSWIYWTIMNGIKSRLIQSPVFYLYVLRFQSIGQLSRPYRSWFERIMENLQKTVELQTEIQEEVGKLPFAIASNETLVENEETNSTSSVSVEVKDLQIKKEKKSFHNKKKKKDKKKKTFLKKSLKVSKKNEILPGKSKEEEETIAASENQHQRETTPLSSSSSSTSRNEEQSFSSPLTSEEKESDQKSSEEESLSEMIERIRQSTDYSGEPLYQPLQPTPEEVVEVKTQKEEEGDSISEKPIWIAQDISSSFSSSISVKKEEEEEKVVQKRGKAEATKDFWIEEEEEEDVKDSSSLNDVEEEAAEEGYRREETMTTAPETPPAASSTGDSSLSVEQEEELELVEEEEEDDETWRTLNEFEEFEEEEEEEILEEEGRQRDSGEMKKKEEVEEIDEAQFDISREEGEEEDWLPEEKEEEERLDTVEEKKEAVAEGSRETSLEEEDNDDDETSLYEQQQEEEEEEEKDPLPDLDQLQEEMDEIEAMLNSLNNDFSSSTSSSSSD